MAYIDAPELSQTCKKGGHEITIGRQATSYLQNLVSSRLQQCRILETDRYGRAVVDCDFNLLIVKSGYAVCYDKYIHDKKILDTCHAYQEYAKQQKVGIWECDDFVEPAVWRKK